MAGIRARLNSASSSKTDSSNRSPVSGASESPTAQAIARIKADLGLSVSPPGGSGSSLLTDSGASPSAVAKMHCRNLTSSLDIVLHRLQTVRAFFIHELFSLTQKVISD